MKVRVRTMNNLAGVTTKYYDFPVYETRLDEDGNPVKVEVFTNTSTRDDLVAQRDALNQKIADIDASGL